MAYALPKWTVFDWETEAIKSRPEYPPKPVGLAVKRPGERRGRYYAFGHPTGNNCSKEEAFGVIRDFANKTSEPMLFQEAKFDIEIACKHVPRFKMPRWDRIHDTKYMLFLYNPHATSLALKPSYETLFGVAPDEQDELKTWILKNVKGARAGNWGEFICLAPGELVGKYAIGDVWRTSGVGGKLLPYIHKHDMLDGYNRERHLMPILLRNEQEGIRTDIDALSTDIPRMYQDIETCDKYLRKRLRKKDLNVSSDAEFGEALAEAGMVRDEDWKLTKTGKRSTSKKNLTPDMFRDIKVFQAYSHRNKLSTCVTTFAQPWLEQAQATGGTIHTIWRQVKGSSGGNDAGGGARSGRMQSSPNFQNIPKNFNKKDPNYSKPTHLDVMDLPLMRRYLLADSLKHVWGRRDYNQQEVRILGHFEGGSLLENYRKDPRYDMHKLVHAGVLEIVGLDFERDRIKAFNFQDIYGGGIPAFCETLGCDYATAMRVKKAKAALMPDVQALREDIESEARKGNPIRTWGGREYYVEESRYVEKHKRVMDFYYKLLNYLIQGSAADCTKEALIRYDEHPKREGRMLVAVHDEINTTFIKGAMKREMQLLREVMQSVEFDLLMLSDGEVGPSWGNLEKFTDKRMDLTWRPRC
jgi:DNA polymerase I-like protein with 3'-5' exonuclease and polymerase domains